MAAARVYISFPVPVAVHAYVPSRSVYAAELHTSVFSGDAGTAENLYVSMRMALHACARLSALCTL